MGNNSSDQKKIAGQNKIMDQHKVGDENKTLDQHKVVNENKTPYQNKASVNTYIYSYHKYHSVDRFDASISCMVKRNVRYEFIRYSNKESLPLDWEEKCNEWFFTYGQKTTYKSRFIIYSDVNFKENIPFSFSNYEISNKIQYEKLIV